MKAAIRVEVSVEDRIRQIICNTLIVDLTEVTDGARIQEDLGADSIDCVEIAMDLEEEYGIVIDETAASKIETVEDVIELVEKKMAKLVA